jgi:uncharacterized membrane protein YdjX (TVP38/TMEM64 family)
VYSFLNEKVKTKSAIVTDELKDKLDGVADKNYKTLMKNKRLKSFDVNEQVRRKVKIIMNVLTILSIIGCAIFIFYGLKTQIFTSDTALREFLMKFGFWAPVIFIVFQAIQVVFPILPGGIGLLGGVLLFGPVGGFILNYIGICLGSIAAFAIAKKFGNMVIQLFFSKKMQEKYMKWVNRRKFDTLFTIAIFAPIAPDDFLCYLAGTTKMTFLKFTIIILLGKPLAIAIYTFGLDLIFRQFIEWIV